MNGEREMVSQNNTFLQVILCELEILYKLVEFFTN